MARVFVSYRRADGVYAVGWLAERMRALDTITGVETAFHDAALRAGDDFPDALDREIAGCDLVVAVIGPGWLGERRDGTARISDPDDWIVREIASAFEQGARVVPVLVGGAEHPLASQLHESIGEIARLHALPFGDGRDLDVIVEHIESHLTEIDRERAKLAGLEQPVSVPTLAHPGRIAAGAAGAAIAGALAGWALASYRVCREGVACDLQGTTGHDLYEILMPVFGAYACATGVVGAVLAVRLHRVVRHRWLPLVGTVVFVGSMLFLLAISSRSGNYAIVEEASMNHPRLRFAGIVMLTAIGGIVTAGIVSVRFSTPRAPEHLIAERVRTLGIARDAERWGALLLAIEFSLIAVAGSAILAALDQTGTADSAGPLPNIAFALVFSVILLLVHNSAVSRLDEEQAAIERALVDVPPRYRRNATPRLVAPAFGGGSWLFRTVLALPLIVTIGADVVTQIF